MPPDDGIRVLVLLRDAGAAQNLVLALQGAGVGGDAGVRFLVPPVRGLDFFADEASQADLDLWWASAVPSGARPVYLLMHEDGLEEWLPGIDGTVYVGCPGGRLPPGYPSAPGIVPLAAAGPLELAAAVAVRLGGGGDPLPAPPPAVADPGPSARVAPGWDDVDDDPFAIGASALPRAAPAGLAGPPAPFADLPGTPVEILDRPPPAPADPFDLLGQPEPGPEEDGRAVDPLPSRAPAPRARGFAWPRRRPSSEAAARELAAAVVGRGPTIVVIGSRKGGVGKTSHAAGMAIVAGEVLDLFGHRAAIVDANIANPDAWGHLHLPAGAATVREVVAALAANREPPPPVHAASPALACYPESRESSEYSQTDIDRLATHLRARYTFIVVDMSNRLPDPLAGPEAAAAAYWLEHGDVLVLPTASSKQDFAGVLDYLEIRRRPPTVVPYIVPGDRRNRDHPVTQQYLEAIRQRVQRIVPIPDEADRVRYAGMEGVPVQEVSPNLRAAYRELLEAIVRVPPGAPRT